MRSARDAQLVRTLRPEIQLLRTIAVLAVLLFHLWPGRLPGGYVGVDVFFVISGFLICGQLLREAEATGDVRLGRFWARRARRLLPAALLVALVSAAIVLVAVDRVEWQQFSKELVASIFYGQNWVLAADSVDYFAQSEPHSPVQHYWSLSVEEQFYIGWPLIIAVILLLARRRMPLTRRTAVFLALALTTLASFCYSVATTGGNEGFSYFDTASRAWEFGAGGLLAFVPAGRVSNRAAATGLFWGGIAAIVATCLLYRPDTPFPGAAALLPVAGAAAVILAGSPRTALAPDWLVANRPGQFLGDISYSLYLWHWPLIVLATSVTALTAPLKLAIVAASILLAAASKLWVEDPVRRWRPLTLCTPLLTFGAAAVACVLVAALPASVWYEQNRETRMGLAALENQAQSLKGTCLGAESLVEKSCARHMFSGPITPLPQLARLDRGDPVENGCFMQGFSADFKVCHLNESGTKGRVALVGDSHADAMLPAILELAKSHGWQLDTYLKGSCPLSTVPPQDPNRAKVRSCAAWIPRMLDALKSERYRYVITTRESGATAAASGGRTAEQTTVRSIIEAWQELDRVGTRVIAIRDNPKTYRGVVSCVDKNGPDSPVCARKRRAALLPDYQEKALASYLGDNVRLIDLTSLYCDRTACPAVIGHVLVYRDSDHLTATYVRSLEPYLEAKVDALSW